MKLRHCFGLVCREPQPESAFRTARSRVCIRCSREANRRRTLRGYHRRARRPGFLEDQAEKRRLVYQADAALRKRNQQRCREYRNQNREEIARILRSTTRVCSAPKLWHPWRACQRKTRDASGRCAYHRLAAAA